MKPTALTLVFSVLALGASAQNRDDRCPAISVPSCSWLCQGLVAGTEDQYEITCSDKLLAYPGHTCWACDKKYGACPATYDPSCSWWCEVNGPAGFCSTTESSMRGVICRPCPGSPGSPTTGGNTTYPPPTNSTGSPPPPEYTGGASTFKVGGAAICGLIALMVAF
ncbi:hypothetical protein TWF281_010227 [Arthrobotrys megalospora]